MLIWKKLLHTLILRVLHCHLVQWSQLDFQHKIGMRLAIQEEYELRLLFQWKPHTHCYIHCCAYNIWNVLSFKVEFGFSPNLTLTAISVRTSLSWLICDDGDHPCVLSPKFTMSSGESVGDGRQMVWTYLERTKG